MKKLHFSGSGNFVEGLGRKTTEQQFCGGFSIDLDLEQHLTIVFAIAIKYRWKTDTALRGGAQHSSRFYRSRNYPRQVG